MLMIEWIGPVWIRVVCAVLLLLGSMAIFMFLLGWWLDWSPRDE